MTDTRDEVARLRTLLRAEAAWHDHMAMQIKEYGDRLRCTKGEHYQKAEYLRAALNTETDR